jgi:RNA-directed DNA polymerase
LSKKPTPAVTSRICRRGHGNLGDIVVNSDKEIMSRPAKAVYKWDDINWRRLERSVFKLQKRIYRASKSGDWKRVKRLQKLLLKSKSAKALAVRRVTQINKGKKTAGIDGVKSLSPTQRLKLANGLNLNEKSKPVRRIWIPKPGKSEKRPLGIPTMTDRAKQALVKLALEPEWEAKFAPNSYGFRPARSCQEAIDAIFIAIGKKNAYILDADISACFDNIDHIALLKKLNTFPKLRRVIKKWLRNGVMEGEIFHKTKAGTPQGGVISPLLANIALHGLEYELKKALREDLFQYLKKKTRSPGYRDAMRSLQVAFYADDWVVIHESEEIILKAKQFVEEWLSGIGLTLNQSKTRIVHTLKSKDGNKAGFDFLGFSIRQYPVTTGVRKYKTLIKPSFESQKRHRKVISEKLKHLTAGTQEEVIKALNPIIKGWSNYFRNVVSSKVFGSMNCYVFQKLWKWARWRHPTKGLRWITDKYFRRYKGNNWRFATSDNNRLALHSETHIKRHVKVQGTRTPYDGDLQYWSKRSSKKNFSAHDLAERCI